MLLPLLCQGDEGDTTAGDVARRRAGPYTHTYIHTYMIIRACMCVCGRAHLYRYILNVLYHVLKCYTYISVSLCVRVSVRVRLFHDICSAGSSFVVLSVGEYVCT